MTTERKNLDSSPEANEEEQGLLSKHPALNFIPLKDDKDNNSLIQDFSISLNRVDEKNKISSIRTFINFFRFIVGVGFLALPNEAVKVISNINKKIGMIPFSLMFISFVFLIAYGLWCIEALCRDIKYQGGKLEKLYTNKILRNTTAKYIIQIWNILGQLIITISQITAVSKK